MPRVVAAARPLSALRDLRNATLGVFEHGNGINSMGMGGVTYSYATETTTHTRAIWPDPTAKFYGPGFGFDDLNVYKLGVE